MPTPTHEVYRVLLKVDEVNSLWTFRLHDDDTLQVDIECAGDTPTTQVMTTESIIRDFDQHVDFTYIVAKQVLKKNTPSLGIHTCEIFLAQRMDRDPSVAYPFVDKVTCVLSPTLGFQCELDYDEIDEEFIARRTFDSLDKALAQPVAWSVAEEPVRATLLPLSCGVYTLKGALMLRDSVFCSPIIMNVELLPSGQVGGTGFQSAYRKSSKLLPLTGKWTADSLEIFRAASTCFTIARIFDFVAA